MGLITVRQLLESTEHTIIPISRNRCTACREYAGSKEQERREHFSIEPVCFLIPLRKEQKEMLEAYAKLLLIAVPTIEQVKEEVRCMMAEVFLERKGS